MKKLFALVLPFALAACGASETTGHVRAAPVPIPYSTLGLDRVIGRTGPALVAMFGRPDADVREGPAQKLQFASPICVLDTYLYPRGGESVVTYVDARQPDGSPIDRLSCVNAIARRGR